MDISLDLHQQAECQERSDTKGFEPYLVTVDSCKSELFGEDWNREREFLRIPVEMWKTKLSNSPALSLTSFSLTYPRHPFFFYTHLKSDGRWEKGQKNFFPKLGCVRGQSWVFIPNLRWQRHELPK